MRESQVETKLKIEIEALGGKCLKFVSPGWNGAPDRVVILPGGRVVFVETKAPGKKLELLQKIRAAELKALGCQVRTIDNVKKVKEFADEIRAI